MSMRWKTLSLILVTVASARADRLPITDPSNVLTEEDRTLLNNAQDQIPPYRFAGILGIRVTRSAIITYSFQNGDIVINLPPTGQRTQLPPGDAGPFALVIGRGIAGKDLTELAAKVMRQYSFWVEDSNIPLDQPISPGTDFTLTHDQWYT